MSKQRQYGTKVIPKEMRERGKAYRNYRYRRFQALDDALTIYFHMREVGSWVTVSDICIAMELDESSDTDRKRVRRICQSLQRVNRVEIQNGGHRGRGGFYPLFIRTLE